MPLGGGPVGEEFGLHPWLRREVSLNLSLVFFVLFHFVFS